LEACSGHDMHILHAEPFLLHTVFQGQPFDFPEKGEKND
jgi:hypothetical protein